MSPMTKRDKFTMLAGPVIMWLAGFATCYILHAKGVL